MKIRGLCMVKNEADVIGQSLSAASDWCDSIYVWDNGSTDGTWETVLALSRTLPPVVAERRDTRPFREALRGELFRDHLAEATVGDWWCVLDADEFYIDDPRGFLAAVPGEFDEVWAASFEYYFTEKDVARFEEDPSSYADEVPVEQKLQFYLNNWSEPRFFRLSKRIAWKPEAAWPENLGPAYPVRIRLKHFQYRSPEQIQKRLETRSEPISRGHFPHEGLPQWKASMLEVGHADFTASSPDHAALDWRDRVLDSALLIEDAPGVDYVVVEGALPPIPPTRPAWLRWLRRRGRPLKRLLR
jgi:hypothetical protein